MPVAAVMKACQTHTASLNPEPQTVWIPETRTSILIPEAHASTRQQLDA